MRVFLQNALNALSRKKNYLLLEKFVVLVLVIAGHCVV